MTLGEDIKKEYEDAEHLVREKMEENPDLADSDTRLVLRIIQDAAGVELPISEEEIPAVGTITRASRVVRNQEPDLVDDEVEENRRKKEEQTSEHFKDSDDENRVIWG